MKENVTVYVVVRGIQNSVRRVFEEIFAAFRFHNLS